MIVALLGGHGFVASACAVVARVAVATPPKTRAARLAARAAGRNAESMTLTSQPLLSIPTIRGEVRGQVIAPDAGEERVRAAYPGATWERLAAIKRRYDGSSRFRLNPNIPPGNER